MKNIIVKAVFGMFLSLSITVAHATIVYNVTNTGPTGGTNSCDRTHAHGLWTSSDFDGTGGSCENFFSINSMTLEIDDSGAPADWTAILFGWATNNHGITAEIDLELEDYSDDHTAFSLKTGGSGAFIADWTFFGSMFGTISFDADNKEGVSEFEIEGIVDGYGFQMGEGANDKTADAFGASAWLRSEESSGYTETNTYHWDLNLDLELATVPEPTTLALMGLGMLGFSFRRRLSS